MMTSPSGPTFQPPSLAHARPFGACLESLGVTEAGLSYSRQVAAQLDAGQLADLASQAKHHAKDVPGHSLYLIDTALAPQACSG